MKAKYIGKSSSCVTNGKVYDVEVYAGYYHLIDDEGDKNSYHRDGFELVEDAKPVAVDPFPFRPADDARWYPPFKKGDTVTFLKADGLFNYRTGDTSMVLMVVDTYCCKDDADYLYGPRYILEDGQSYDWRWFIDPPQPVEPAKHEDQPLLRQFASGATRNLDNNKYDYEGFLSPLVIEAFGKYMHSHRLQKDGKMRDSDNWQKGLPIDVYMKSGWRHFFDWWKLHRGLDAASPEDGHKIDKVEALCALMFNVQGYMHELLKEQSNV